ncbi:peptide chain release factor 1 [bacterium]|nr:peptide chain release factor 1 [bacterium]
MPPEDAFQEAMLPIQKALEEIDAALIDPLILKEPRKLKGLGRRRQRVQTILELHQKYLEDLAEWTDLNEALLGNDAELKEIAQEGIEEAAETLSKTTSHLEDALVPRDPDAGRNALVEIRAGTGGDEAALWVGDLFGMYKRMLENDFNIKVLSSSSSEMGGYKEISFMVRGEGAFGWLAAESGIHRVQRVPDTESQGRIHTSAATIAVLPEADDEVEIDLDPRDIKVDTYRASGAGGQHVNKTDSAVRMTHRPSGVVVDCQEERSQHQNRERCLLMLRTKLYQFQVEQRKKEGDERRRSAVGSGDRSEKIRTFNFPQNRVTDHRVGHSIHQLDRVLAGEGRVFFEDIARLLRKRLMDEVQSGA